MVMTSATALTPELLTDRIRSAGLKVTTPRLAVLSMLETAPHSSAEQVFASVRNGLPGTSVQAVYGVLAAFTAAGLIRRFDPPASPALFESRVGDNHHHIVCIRCNNMSDVDCVVGEAPCLTPSDVSGFHLISAEITFTGICSDCQAALAAEEDAIPA